MSEKLVNLDALIKREDLEIVPGQKPIPGKRQEDSPIKLDELAFNHRFFRILRKPDYQRETSSWTPEAIANLVKNQLDGDVVPAIILWTAPNNEVFVIDGAHRLSALIAYVNNDYGDREFSRLFFGTEIPRAQEKIGDETRLLIEKTVGSFEQLSRLSMNPQGGDQERIKRANALALTTIKTQWVPGDALAAERSFVRINQGGAVISPIEKEIIRARVKPEGLAARALLRAGMGHQYWWRCGKENNEKIVSLAKKIYDLLYKPEPQGAESDFNAVPVAGKAYSSDTLEVLFELVHVSNNIKRERVKKGAPSAEEEAKPKTNEEMQKIGETTIIYLESVCKYAEQIFSREKNSLGLHPAVYCRSATGRFQPTMFLAQVRFIQKLENESEGFHIFTKHRAAFEGFLINYKYFINQLVRGIGAGTKSLDRLLKMYFKIYEEIKSGKTESEIKTTLLEDEDLSHHLSEVQKPQKGKRGAFSANAKAAIRMRSELDTAKPCPECKARMHPLATTIDHTVRKADGGTSSPEDGEEMHPFCNSGVKERRVRRDSMRTA